MKSLFKKIDSLPAQEELKKWLRPTKVQNFFVIYDQVLDTLPFFRQWIKSFPMTYPVQAGEGLKSVDTFADHISAILNRLQGVPHQELCVVAVGGGSVGDFSGFVASVLRRGVNIVHVPSTWLAAIDSAHGGKTALNVGGFKNQIGTYWPARLVVAVKDLLRSAGRFSSKHAMGELIKIGIINRPQILKQLLAPNLIPEAILWENLAAAVSGKMKIVLNDPKETKGERIKLNLGHTLGHALEANFGLPHGLAVAQGIYFSANWSLQSGLLSKRDHQSVINILNCYFSEQRDDGGQIIGNWRASELKRIVSGDKKIAADSSINFVFIKKPGRVIVAKVAIGNLIKEAVRQGWAI